MKKTRYAIPENVGYIYVVANKYIPYLVKVGRTQDDPEIRRRNLSRHEGVPGEYRFIFLEEVFDCHITETEIHQKFELILKNDGYGVKNKEFFVVPSPGYAIHQVRRIIRACTKSYKKKPIPYQPDIFGNKTSTKSFYYAKDQTIWKVFWRKAFKPKKPKGKKFPIEGSFEMPVNWPKEWWKKKKS